MPVGFPRALQAIQATFHIVEPLNGQGQDSSPGDGRCPRPVGGRTQDPVVRKCRRIAGIVGRRFKELDLVPRPQDIGHYVRPLAGDEVRRGLEQIRFSRLCIPEQGEPLRPEFEKGVPRWSVPETILQTTTGPHRPGQGCRPV